MHDVTIIERMRTCRVICPCGLNQIMVKAPRACPVCGKQWENPHFEEDKTPVKKH